MSTVTFNLQPRECVCVRVCIGGVGVVVPVGDTLNRSGLLSASCILMRAKQHLWTV